MESAAELVRQPVVWVVLAWLAAAQIAYVALWLPARSRGRWVEGTVRVTGAQVVSSTMQGTTATGQGLYQLHGTVSTPHGPVESRSVEQVKGARVEAVMDRTLPCRYDPANPRLMTLVPASAPVLGSPKGIGVLLVVLALVVVPLLPVLRDAGVL